MIYVTPELYLAIRLLTWFFILLVIAFLVSGLHTWIRIRRNRREHTAIRLKILRLQTGLSRQLFDSLIGALQVFSKPRG